MKLIQTEGPRLEEGITSEFAASEVIRFLGDAVVKLEEAGFSNRWRNGERTEYHLHASVAPGVDVGTPEWDEAHEKSKSLIQVIGGRIYTNSDTGKPLYASVNGEFAHVPLTNPRVARSAADTWHARITIPTPEDGQTQRVVMDTWNMPMQTFWEHASSSVLQTEAEFAEYKKWYSTWHKSTPQGIPIRAQNIAHDVLGRNEILNKDARRRFLWHSQHIGSLVSNVCEKYLIPEQV